MFQHPILPWGPLNRKRKKKKKELRQEKRSIRKLPYTELVKVVTIRHPIKFLIGKILWSRKEFLAVRVHCTVLLIGVMCTRSVLILCVEWWRGRRWTESSSPSPSSPPPLPSPPSCPDGWASQLKTRWRIRKSPLIATNSRTPSGASTEHTGSAMESMGFLLISVSDPYSFFTDPDPGHKSEYGSGSWDLNLHFSKQVFSFSKVSNNSQIFVVVLKKLVFKSRSFITF